MDTTTDPSVAASATATHGSLQERFAALLGQHRGIVLKVAHGYCRCAEDRADLVQDISVQAWRAFPGWDEARGRFSTWLYRIALNVAISQLRRRQARERHHAVVDPEGLAAIPDPRAAVPALDQVQAVLASLPAYDRALLLLHLDDCSHREIAEVLGISPGNVATRLHRLRGRLRHSMTGDDRRQEEP